MQMGKNDVFKKARKLEVAERVNDLNQGMEKAAVRIFERAEIAHQNPGLESEGVLAKEVALMNQEIQTMVDSGMFTQSEADAYQDKAGNALVDILIKTKTSETELPVLLKTLEALRDAGIGSELAIAAGIEDTKYNIEQIEIRGVVATNTANEMSWGDQYRLADELFPDDGDKRKAYVAEVEYHESFQIKMEASDRSELFDSYRQRIIRGEITKVSQITQLDREKMTYSQYNALKSIINGGDGDYSQIYPVVKRLKNLTEAINSLPDGSVVRRNALELEYIALFEDNLSKLMNGAKSKFDSLDTLHSKYLYGKGEAPEKPVLMAHAAYIDKKFEESNLTDEKAQSKIWLELDSWYASEVRLRDGSEPEEEEIKNYLDALIGKHLKEGWFFDSKVSLHEQPELMDEMFVENIKTQRPEIYYDLYTKYQVEFGEVPNDSDMRRAYNEVYGRAGPVQFTHSLGNEETTESPYIGRFPRSRTDNRNKYK